MKKRITVFLAIAGFFLALYWLYGHSRLVIVADGGTDTSYSYHLLNQDGGAITQLKSDSNTITKVVKKGDYQILVTNGSKNHFSIVKTSGFLGSTKVEVKLEPEKNRLFTGDGPKECMNHIKVVLISYDCNDLYTNIQIHKPATSTTSTYTQKNPNTGVSGYVEGIIEITEGNLMLLKTIPTSEGVDGGGHQIYKIGQNLKLSSPVRLATLDANTDYSISPFNAGFLVYELNTPQAIYYPSTKSAGESIKIESPNDKNLIPVSMSVHNDSVLNVYSSKPADDSHRSEVIVTNSQAQSRHYEFGSTLSNTTSLCGNTALCSLKDSKLEVYDISGTSPKKLYSIVNVLAVQAQGNESLVVTRAGVIRLDINTGTGYFEYMLGEYLFNGIRGEQDGYILSLTNDKGRRIALRVDQAQDSSGGIDKKIAELQKNAAVEVVSAYGNYIYITADIGELVYNQATGRYSYDPTTKRLAAESINKAIDDLQIDRSVYEVSSNAF